jgi:transcriptional regulator with XRE-family HTH domain
MDTKHQEIMIILSRNLRAQRIKLDFTQEKLAKISGLSVQTINDIEGGRRWVSAKSITKLSTALNVECFKLLIPNLRNQNLKDTTMTLKLIKLKDNIHKNIDFLFNSHFNNFIKNI